LEVVDNQTTYRLQKESQALEQLHSLLAESFHQILWQIQQEIQYVIELHVHLLHFVHLSAQQQVSYWQLSVMIQTALDPY
jgi:hypothetical protein